MFALTVRRPRLTRRAAAARGGAPRRDRSGGIAGVFLIGAAPLLWQAAQLMMRGEYVTQEHGWRSVPRGVDLLTPLLGHPLHP